MAGGKAYHCGSLSVGGTTISDITAFSASMSADHLHNRADCRMYPQKGATVNHMATIAATTLDLSNAKQSSTPLIGEIVSNVILTINDNATSSMVYTLSKAERVSAEVAGGYGNLANLDMAFQACGEGGVEPTVTWGVGA